MREIEGPVPERLAAWWEPIMYCLHSAPWWRSHREKMGIVNVEPADSMPDGWQFWLQWQNVVAPENLAEIRALESDAGGGTSVTFALSDDGDTMRSWMTLFSRFQRSIRRNRSFDQLPESSRSSLPRRMSKPFWTESEQRLKPGVACRLPIWSINSIQRFGVGPTTIGTWSAKVLSHMLIILSSIVCGGGHGEGNRKSPQSGSKRNTMGAIGDATGVSSGNNMMTRGRQARQQGCGPPRIDWAIVAGSDSRSAAGVSGEATPRPGNGRHQVRATGPAWRSSG